MTQPQPPLQPNGPLGYQSPGAANSGQEVMATIIPYRNVPALTSYYLGVFSIFPCLGVALGVAAVVLGIKGLKLAARNPNAKGKAHAIVGIVCGSVFGLIWLVIDALIIIGMIIRATHP
jgi:hypothetical protein